MKIAEWIGLVCILGGGISLVRSLMKHTEEVPKELQEIRKALEKRQQIEVSLEEIGRYAWLQGFELQENLLSSTDSQEAFSEKENLETQEKITTENKIENEEVLKYYRELSEKSRTFFDNVVLPIYEVLEKDKSLESVLKVLVLLSKKGNIPSVVGDVFFKEPVQYRMFKKITLEEHSLNVAVKGMEIVKKELPYMFNISPGKYLLIFLGHDLGKIYVHKKGYATGDHPVISARILNEIIPDDLDWKASVLQIVKNHHIDGTPFEKDSSEAFDLEILKRADRLAREEEIRNYEAVCEDSLEEEEEKTQEGQPLSNETALEARFLPGTGATKLFEKDISDDWVMPEGVTPMELLACLRSWVNRIVTAEDLSNPASPIPPDTPEGNFLAVSQPNGIVYIRPDLIYYGLMKIVSQKKKEKENATLIALPKNEALKHIIAWLMKHGYVVPGHVREGYIGRWYAFRLGDKEYTSLFVPIPAEAFGVLPSELERERKSVLKVCDVHGFRKISKFVEGAK